MRDKEEKRKVTEVSWIDHSLNVEKKSLLFIKKKITNVIIQ